MGIKKSDFDGRLLKKQIDKLKKARQRYHNKHVDGSGNFGYTLKTEGDEWYNLNGDYNSDKEIFNLRFGRYGASGHKIKPNSIKELTEAINKSEV